jgi:fused signal recognition particle receptor
MAQERLQHEAYLRQHEQSERRLAADAAKAKAARDLLEASARAAAAAADAEASKLLALELANIRALQEAAEQASSDLAAEYARVAAEKVEQDRLLLEEQTQMMQALQSKASTRNAGRKWLANMRQLQRKREAEERAARIQLKMLKMQAEIEASYQDTLSKGEVELHMKSSAFWQEKAANEIRVSAAEEARQAKQVLQLRRCCKQTKAWLFEEAQKTDAEKRLMQLDYDQEPLEGGEDADVVDIFALPEDMVYESAEKKKNERASKKEIAYIRGEDAVINTMVRTPPPPCMGAVATTMIRTHLRLPLLIAPPCTPRTFRAPIR